ncbi:class I SAM-dependent DNA methyltransferase, partial [Clostridium tyrobutyricum]|nr:class I SAM-dependent DNA methyltransferase [Clostridium tyrobutyricum]
MDDFLKNIYKIYEFINKEVSVYEKNDYIDIFKRSMKINVKDRFSTRYYKYIKDSKRSGIVYTPKKIADYMVKNLIDSEILPGV